MPDTEKVLHAIGVLTEQFGRDIDHVVDLNRLLRSRCVLHHCRQFHEWRISREYLPGFRFVDDFHAYWFLTNCVSWPFWHFEYPLSQDHWDEKWIRMFLVPNRKHYLSEVARALQAYDQKTEAMIREYHEIRATGDRKKIASAARMMALVRGLNGLPPGPVRNQRNLMAMSSWLDRMSERFGEFELPTTPRSIHRLGARADEYRKARRGALAPSGWQIVQLVYHGTIVNPTAEDRDSWQKRTQSYYERWVWVPIEGVDPPVKVELSFIEPARPNLWSAAWRSLRKNERLVFVD